MRVSRSIAAVAAALALALAGCSSGNKDQSAEPTDETATSGEGEVVTLRVGASPSPHANVLQFVQDNLAEANGLNLDIIEYTDYIEPNKQLQAGNLDANWFQHIPYLEEWAAENNWEYERGEGTHLEPLGLYSSKHQSAEDVPEGAVIGIINDPTNQERALVLLSDQGFVELPESGPINAATVTTLNGVELKEVEGPALVRNLQDLDFAAINGNFAQEGGLTPADAVALESTENNPYVNVLVWNPDSPKIESIKKLDALLHSPEVQEYISQTWPDKSVIPAR